MPGINDSAFVINMLQIGVPFAAYFVGIIVRKIALPGLNSPQLSRQLLLGIPFSLVIVSPLLIVFAGEIKNVSACLVTVGLIMEQGMLVGETATTFIDEKVKAMINKPGPASQVPASAE